MGNFGLTVLVRSDGHLVGTFEDVFVSIWWAPANVERLQGLQPHQEAMAKAHPEGFGNLAILGAGAGKVTADVRAEAERISKRPQPMVRATAQVIEGTGFGAAVVRSVAMAMMTLSRSPAPSKIFDALPAGAVWLMTKLGRPADAPNLVDAVLEARARAS